MELSIVKYIGLLTLSTFALSAQNTGVLQVRVVDPRGVAVASAKVELSNLLTNYTAGTESDGAGEARLAGIPFQTYRLQVKRDGFAIWDETVSLRSAVPVVKEIQLQLAAAATVVEVKEDVSVLVDPEETGAHLQMNRADLERLSLQTSARGLESVLVTFPGFAQNANGAIHPRGAHNQMTYVIDGMPISDQLTGAFANAVDPNIVQTVELFTGNIPAEFGNKISAVAQITTRSGAGLGRPAAGSILLAGAEPFDTASTVAQVAGEPWKGRLGYSASVYAMRTHRYLDSVSLDNLHNSGDAARIFGRLDWHATPNDIIRATMMAGRSDFQLANLRSQHANGMNASQELTDGSASVSWVRTLSPAAVFESTGSWRGARALLQPSPGDTPVSAAQDRTLDTFTHWNRLSVVRGSHQLKIGVDWQRFPVREQFTFAAVDPGLTGLPAREFAFAGRGTGGLYSGFFQDRFRAGRWQLTLGLRYDDYRFLARGTQWQPRLGVAYELIPQRTVLRLSYNRTYQTPPNENLLLSHSEFARTTLGAQLIPIQPERQNFYEAGIQQAIGRKLSLTVSVYHKNARDQNDNNNFFETGVIFPISLARIRVNSVEGRLATLPWATRIGVFSGTLSATHSRAISTPPFTGGLFFGQEVVDSLSQGPFVIDHDQKLSLHGILSWTHRKGWFATSSTRYDSGLVANPSDPAEVASDPDYADLLPYVNLGSNPARTRPRTVQDVTFGYTRLKDTARQWEASVQVANLTGVTALYNFQSIFVGTRVVQPRTFGVRLRYYF